jgi:hypothetical protein
MAHGGARKGAGRKPVHDEQRARDLAISAIVAKHGSEAAGFAALLNTNEPTLVKWVYEHGYGKPKETLDVTTREEKIVVDFEEEGEADEEQDDTDEETEDGPDDAADTDKAEWRAGDEDQGGYDDDEKY